ncbi:MAG: ABC transporter permease [Bryobacteraceae bacterium]|nr:ABC transporter permease [Solibacteraceae bacterium]MCO5353814.1 ABC transporter permease [Bryobacteraceae bacterium]
MTPTLAEKAVLNLPGAKFVRVLHDRRSLIYELVRRDFETRFVGSAAGWLWTMIHPLVLLVSWVFVFQYCLKVPPPPGAGDSYTLYLFCGYLPWMLFQDTVQRSSVSLLEQSSLITKTVFPSEILPLTIFLSSLTSHAIAVALTAVVVFLLKGHFSVLILFLPLYTALLGIFAIGVAWIFASLQVYLRDTAQFVVVIMTGWFWLTPIFIDETHFPEGARFLVHWNPVAYVVKGYRQRLLMYELPNWGEVAVLATAAIAVFFVGGMVFRHLKRGFADVL